MPFNHNPVDLGYQELLCETGESGRKYLSPQGKAYPSITTVLSILSADHIREWRKAVGNEEANRVSRVAAGRGTTVHALVEKFLNNEELDLSKEMPNASSAFKSIRGILENRVNNIRLQEKPLYSDHLGVAGRVDLVAEFDGKLAIIDIKTSSRVKTAEDIESYFMQEAAYAIMFEERTGIPVTRLVTIMTVDFHEALIFNEYRDNWTKKLLETIAEYKRRKLFGHI
jgi:genome maintenance exonuclease 1